MSEFWHIDIDIDGYGLVRVNTSLMQELAIYRQLGEYLPESGGILIGKHLNSGGRLVIETLTPPQPTDIQGRCNYFRSKAHNELAQEVWKASDGHSTYVGLWHTHPEPRPHPSSVDKQDWRNALKKSGYEGKHLFFFIVGQTYTRCWVGQKKRFRTYIELVGEYCHGE